MLARGLARWIEERGVDLDDRLLPVRRAPSPSAQSKSPIDCSTHALWAIEWAYFTPSPIVANSATFFPSTKTWASFPAWRTRMDMTTISRPIESWISYMKYCMIAQTILCLKTEIARIDMGKEAS